jgi:uncharacterized membrane protein HdeD (DUF308 family)
MAIAAQNRLSGAFVDEVNRVWSNWGLVLAFGIAQIIVGIVAVSFAFDATIASVLTLGIVLLISAGVQTAAAIWARGWGGFFLFLGLGILFGAAGFVMLVSPLAAAESLTLLFAVFCLVGGAFRIIVSVVERFPAWGWVVFNGAITILLGVAILAQWPQSGLWVLGLFVGIDLIFNGASWSAIAAGLRRGLSAAARV